MDTAQPPQSTFQIAAGDEDTSLIERFLSGDETAFTSLVNKYRQQVYAVAWRLVGNAQEADDLAQETFIKAYRNLSKFRGDAKFKTWLLRITTNAGINMKKSGRMSKDSGEAPDENQAASAGGALDDILDNERKLQLRRAIDRLPPKQKQTLMLKTYQDMTCEEVAGVLNCSTGTVKANIFNALKKLKTFLEPGGNP